MTYAKPEVMSVGFKIIFLSQALIVLSRLVSLPPKVVIFY